MAADAAFWVALVQGHFIYFNVMFYQLWLYGIGRRSACGQHDVNHSHRVIFVSVHVGAQMCELSEINYFLEGALPFGYIGQLQTRYGSWQWNAYGLDLGLFLFPVFLFADNPGEDGDGSGQVVWTFGFKKVECLGGKDELEANFLCYIIKWYTIVFTMNDRIVILRVESVNSKVPCKNWRISLQIAAKSHLYKLRKAHLQWRWRISLSSYVVISFLCSGYNIVEFK